MISSTEEFAQVWKKPANELTRLDYFIFLLINEMDSQLRKSYFNQDTDFKEYNLNTQNISELVLQLGDSLHFFYEQMCFGDGCSLGCPNKLDKPFSEKEDDVRLEIIKQEFGGKKEACSSRDDCLRHDLMSYVAVDTLLDFYNYNMNLVCEEKDPAIVKLAAFIVNIIIRFTTERGSELLKEPYKNAALMFN